MENHVITTLSGRPNRGRGVQTHDADARYDDKYFAYQAYCRSGSSPLRALAVGFSLVTVSSILDGVHQLFQLRVGDAIFVMLGFLVLTSLLYMRDY